MLKVDKKILDINKNICKNIEMTKNFERGFISQNILAQLRNFVEHISFKEYCNGRDLEITFENLQEGNKFVEENGGFNISFPDLPGAFTCGEDFEDTMYMAKDCLEVYLHDLDEILKVSTPNKLSLKEGEFVILIEADLLSFRKKI